MSELLGQIDSLRQDLANIDQNLDDASNIASGWLDAMISATQNPEGPELAEGLEDYEIRKSFN